MAFDVRHIIGSPKTTIVGVCVLGGVALNALQFDVTGHLAMSTKSWTAVAVATLGAVVAGFSQDADKQLADVPSGETKDVESHGTPNDPEAKPVK